MDIKFGTGGWRAPIKNICKDDLYRLAHSVALYCLSYCKGKPRIIIGYDNRLQSQRYAEFMFSVLTKDYALFDVEIFNEAVSTPMTMKYVAIYNCTVGLMVTASHNPGTFNGVKVIEAPGRDATVETTTLLENYINNVKTLDNYVKYLFTTFKYVDARSHITRYVSELLSDVDVDKIRSRHFAIAFDAMHTSALPIMNYLVNALNLEVASCNTTQIIPPDYTPCPTAENNQLLVQSIKDSPREYDIGIAFDGDGDRLGLIDNWGHYVDGNDLLCLLTWYMYGERGLKSDVAMSYCSTGRMHTIANHHGHKVIETPIGVKWLIDAHFNKDVMFAGEQNGGIVWPEHLLGKDSINTLVLVLEMLAKTGYSLNMLIESLHEVFGNTYCISEQVSYNGNRKDIEDKIYNDIPVTDILVKSISHLDGVKLTFGDGEFLLYRVSGTEPIIRIMSESHNEAQSKHYIEIGRNYLKSKGVI